MIYKNFLFFVNILGIMGVLNLMAMDSSGQFSYDPNRYGHLDNSGMVYGSNDPNFKVTVNQYFNINPYGFDPLHRWNIPAKYYPEHHKSMPSENKTESIPVTTHEKTQIIEDLSKLFVWESFKNSSNSKGQSETSNQSSPVRVSSLQKNNFVPVDNNIITNQEGPTFLPLEESPDRNNIFFHSFNGKGAFKKVEKTNTKPLTALEMLQFHRLNKDK